MAFFMLLMISVVTLFFAMSLDAGVWYADHRTAQNQAEEAALAAVQELPAADTSAAVAAGNSWLTKNGATACGPACMVFSDATGDGKADTVRVSVSRKSPGFFSKLAGINFVSVSAAATARRGPVDSTNVMPWAVIAPDPTCTEAAGRNCLYNANTAANNATNPDTDFTDPGDCNAAWILCPFGLTADRLYAFKIGTGGNTNILAVCGAGASNYRACLSGATSSGIFQVGQTVAINSQPGTLANSTDAGLEARPPAGAWALPGGAVCNVLASPLLSNSQSPGYDPDGKLLAAAAFVNPVPNKQCAFRLVPIPITTAPGQGSSTVTVLGFATFAVAAWDTNNGNGNQFVASASNSTCHSVKNNQVTANDYPCGTVWGYLFTGVTPPDALLSQIGSSKNPFAPVLIALVN